MPRLLALLLCVLLCGCRLNAGGPQMLNFTAGPVGGQIVAATLLAGGVVPADRLLSLPQALARAPQGSLLLMCWRTVRLANSWGVCSHLARKLGPGQVADQPSIFQSAGIRPTSSLLNRYAVIVLDAGVRPEQFAALNTEVQRLNGQMYSLSGAPGSSDCSTYQNELQRALKLPEAVAFNTAWNGYLPADALRVPGVKVLWVGVNVQAAR